MRMLPTDEQIVERIRSGQRYRRPLGAVCAVLGVGGILLVLLAVRQLQTQSNAVFEELSRSPHPTTQQLAQSVDQARFGSGFEIGFMCAAGLAGASSLVASGCVWLLFTNRRDALLLKCWSRSPVAQ